MSEVSNKEVFYKTVKELDMLGPENIPDEYIPNCHLIYSSPATLSYNSPGAIGFGVKRAGLVIPESVMLLVGPACCGRNSTILSEEEGYAKRMFYLQMDETDLVTGRHLDAIDDAVQEILESVIPEPKVILICTTCVDALLATDLESICLDASEKFKVHVVPSYMYALTREGRKPPMSIIRQTIYSLLEKSERKSDRVNIMGFFSGLDPDNEFFKLLKNAGIKKILEIGNMKSLEEYHEMSSSNFNIVLDRESNIAAEDLLKRLGMPYIELTRVYSVEKIHKQYKLFSKALDTDLDDSGYYEKAKERVKAFSERSKGHTFTVGEMTNADPFELTLALTEMGLIPKAIFSNITENNYVYIKKLAELAPDIKVFTGISPSMMNYEKDIRADIAIGKDAVIYTDAKCNVEWFSEIQPFGYKGVCDLLDLIEEGER